MAATALVAAGVDVKTAQARLGHSTPTTTLAIYARTTADADRRAADAIGGALHSARARSAHDDPEVEGEVLDLPPLTSTNDDESSGGETRTLNHTINSRVLCRLSYPGKQGEAYTG